MTGHSTPMISSEQCFNAFPPNTSCTNFEANEGVMIKLAVKPVSILAICVSLGLLVCCVSYQVNFVNSFGYFKHTMYSACLKNRKFIQFSDVSIIQVRSFFHFLTKANLASSKVPTTGKGSCITLDVIHNLYGC